MLDVRADDLQLVREILASQLPKNAKTFTFGSRVTGRAARGSDLDLAVDIGRAMTIAEVSQLEMLFIESMLLYSVDMVDVQSVDETFRMIIEKKCGGFSIAIAIYYDRDDLV